MPSPRRPYQQSHPNYKPLTRLPAQANTTPAVKPVLDKLELKIVEQYMIDCDRVAVAERIGLSLQEVNAQLAKKSVRAALQIGLLNRTRHLGIEQDYILKKWIELLETDHREISEHWRVACRYCWGHNHRYQFTDVELHELIAEYRYAYEAGPKYRQRELDGFNLVSNQIWKAKDLGKDDGESELPPFDDLGGDGYTILRDPMRGQDWVDFVLRKNVAVPNPEANADETCPACWGFGVPHIIQHDTRNYSRGAAALYMGVEAGANSIKILTRNKAEIEQYVARLLGYFVERKLVLVGDADRLTDTEIEAAIQEELAERARLIEHESTATNRSDGETRATVPAEAGERATPEADGPDTTEPFFSV